MSNPFEIAAKGKTSRLMREDAEASAEWLCSQCTFNNNTMEIKKGRTHCEMCGNGRPQSSDDEPPTHRARLGTQAAAPTTARARAPAPAPAAASLELDEGTGTTLGSAAVQYGEAGVLSLAGLFTRLFGRHVRELATWWRDLLDGERIRFQAEFRGVEGRIKEQMAMLERLVEEVESTRKRVEGRDSMKDMSDHESWIFTKINGDAHCSICSEFSQHWGGDRRVLKSPWIEDFPTKVNLFEKSRGDMRKSVESHAESELHARCVQAKADASKQPTIIAGFSAMAQLERESMQNLLKIVMHIAKHKGSFYEYERLVYLGDYIGAEVGQREHSRKTARSMLIVSAQVGQEIIQNFLTTINVLMNHKPHVTWKADKVSDSSSGQFELVNIRVNYNGTPIQLHLAIAPIDGAYSNVDGGVEGTSPEAGSLVCFNTVLEVLEKFGIEMITAREGSSRANISIYEVNDFPAVGLGVAEQVRCGAADGEACYNGTGQNNVKALFKDPVRGFGDSTHHMSHDPSHALDLLKADGNKALDYVADTVHKNVRAVYAHYSTSPKRLRGLLRLCDKWGVQFDQLHYLFEIRFLASEVLVFEHFLTDLPAIVLHLREELAQPDEDTSKDVKAKINGWLRIITQFKFVSTLITQLDIDAPMKEFSVKAQNDSTLWIFYPDMLTRLCDDLKALRTSPGPVGKKRLSQLAQGELHSTVDASSSKPRVRDGETDARVEPQGDGTFIIKIKLLGAPAAGRDETVRRLLVLQHGNVESIISNLKSRLPLSELLVRLKGVFDFNLMELSNPSPAAFEKIQTHGDDDIEWLVEKYFPMLDAQILKNQALKVRLYVKNNYGRFFDTDEADPSWRTKRRQSHVPKPSIRIAGPDSIMEALFSSPAVVGIHIEQYLHLADYMIALDIKTADVERVGSHMQLVKGGKDARRSSLHNTTYAALVFLSFNLPHLHEIDLDVLITAWKKAGHLLPIHKNGAESRVLSRLKSRSSSTFFMKKNSPFLPTNFDFLGKSSFFVEPESDDDDED
jgi:hypothetical protein